ncbi:MAG: serine hydrolase [Alphaproteobacteria bacterium]|nr:serine hydrolase [Alphaproteobacteria bacterium]
MAVISTAIGLLACAADPDGATNRKAYHDRLEAAFDELEAKGFTGVVGVAMNGEAPVFRGMGAAKNGVPDKNRLVDIGSITKTITAVAVMKLVDNGLLDTADTLGDIFEEAPADKTNITVHQLLTHSAGMPGAIGDDYEKLKKDAFLKRMFAAPLISAPGSAYAYSNVGYSVLAAIIEKRSGKSYDAFLREDVFAGTGVNNIGYANGYDSARSLLSSDGGDIASVSWGGDQAYWNLVGNGGLTATAKDFLLFRSKFVRGEIVSPQSVKIIQTAHIREGEGAPSFYGYGLVVQDNPKLGHFYWHNGANMHFTSNWTDHSDKGLVIFTASSSPDIDADTAYLIIISALLDIKLSEKRMDAPDEAADGAAPNSAMAAKINAFATAFTSAVQSDDPADWEKYILDYGADAFIALAPMEAHMHKFKSIHMELKELEVTGIRVTDDGQINLEMRHPVHKTQTIVHLGYAGTEDLKLTGLGIDN